METISLTIDGKSVRVAPGTSILAAAERNGITIPTLCHHPQLKAYGACRICIVEDDASGRLMAACVTPVARGMSIQSASPRVLRHRRNIVRLMMAEHPESCVVCNKGNRCELRRIAANLGIGEHGLYPMPNFKPLEQANPFIVRDLSKCILCGKCIRADHELVMVGAIDYSHRGFSSRPATVFERGLENSACTFCGTCVSMCPTGALSPKTRLFVGTPEHEETSVCGFCGVGCRLTIGSFGDQVVEVNPSRETGTVNGATLCVRGHFAHDFLNSKNRLTRPIVREGGKLEPISWNDALDQVTRRFLDIRREHGSQSIAFLGSSKCTNEENFLFQKIARTIFGTNNIANNGNTAGGSLIGAIEELTDGRSRINPLSRLETAEAIVLLGADPSNSAPVVSYYLKRASREGVPLVIADHRRTDISGFASIWLPLIPSANLESSFLELLNGLAVMLIKHEAHNNEYIDRYTSGFDTTRHAFDALDIDRICRKTGLDSQQIEAAADAIAGKPVAFVVGEGILQQKYSLKSVHALVNLALLTGSIGSPAGGIFVITRENNLVGSRDMGTIPDSLPGREPLGNDSARMRWERAWKTQLSPDPGLDMVRMIREAEKGNLKALYVMGENPLRSLPQPDRVAKAFSNLEFLVVQDIVLSETAAAADVVLPGAAFAEKDGSFTNMEGRIQIFSSVVPPPGDARPDWEILNELAGRMDAAHPAGTLADIQAEIRRLVPMYADDNGGSYRQWVREIPLPSGKPGDPGAERIPFAPVSVSEDDQPDIDYPFTAILCGHRFHLGSGTRTSHSGRIREFGRQGRIELSAIDARRLGVEENDAIRVRSRYGAIERPVKIRRDLNPGLICVPTAYHGNDALKLIVLSRPGTSDPTGSFGWKTCPVTLEKPEGARF